MKILLIEDSRFMRVSIERSLIKAGHEVTGLADGSEALQAARRISPAVIILDMMLPGLDGTCVLHALKQDVSTSHIPVIVLTGLSQKNEAKLIKAGAAAYIEKSSTELDKHAAPLLQAIARIIGTSDVAVSTPSPDHLQTPVPDKATDNAAATVLPSEVVA